MSNEHGLSRRAFIKDAALAGAAVATGGALSALSAEPAVAAPSIPEKWDKDVDVIIIGFGIAGSAAALEAHDSGTKVLIVEKTKWPGGCATLSGGVVYAAGTSLQKEAGIDDSPDGMFKYWMAMGQGLNNPDMVRIWCDESAGRFEWLRAQGVKYAAGTAPKQNPKNPGGKGLYYTGAEPDPWVATITPPCMRGHATSAVTPSWPYPPASDTLGTNKPNYPNAGGTGIFRPFYEGVQSRGIEVLMETQVTDLIAKLDTKEVLGVKATAGGKELFIRAKRAVILASGGFAHNPQMLKYYATENGAKNVGTSSINSDTGDGHRMGMALGAQPVNMNLGSLMYTITPGAILVNQGGRRFVDETLTKVNAQAMKGQLRDAAGAPVVYEIFDETMRTTVSSALVAGAAKTTIQAPTIKELAANIGIDPTVLENTVNTYNESVKTGKDLEFGRTALQTSQVAPGMSAIKDPPFHALRTLAEMTMTTGGLLINTKTQLVDTNGKVIPRLYAAGAVAHTVVGLMYTSGVHIMSGMVFGRIAGKNAAGETPLA